MSIHIDAYVRCAPAHEHDLIGSMRLSSKAGQDTALHGAITSFYTQGDDIVISAFPQHWYNDSRTVLGLTQSRQSMVALNTVTWTLRKQRRMHDHLADGSITQALEASLRQHLPSNPQEWHEQAEQFYRNQTAQFPENLTPWAIANPTYAKQHPDFSKETVMSSYHLRMKIPIKADVAIAGASNPRNVSLRHQQERGYAGPSLRPRRPLL